MFKGKITIIGATGVVGRNVLQLIANSDVFDDVTVRVAGSRKSAGTTLKFRNKKLIVCDAENLKFMQNEICILNTEADISSYYAQRALNEDAYVVDSSSHYRLNKDVPLIIPHIGVVNVEQSHLFAHANCIVSPLASVMHALHQEFKIQRAIISTYQSASGAGKIGMDECLNDTRIFCETGYRGESKAFARSIAFNVIPQIGAFDDDGTSSEESKIVHELHKVVSHSIDIFATAVRVPVLIGHSSSLSLRLSNSTNIEEIKNVLRSAMRVKVTQKYQTPIDVIGQDDVFVSRIRYSESNGERWCHMWVCSDNLRVGAAYDSFAIAAEIAKQIA